MEPITPKTSENKTSQKGIKFWAVEDNAGTKYTIWDETIAQIWEANFGNGMLMDVKRSGNFLNIRGIEDKGQVLKEVQNGERSLNGQEQKSVDEEKFRTPKEMVATELVKAVLGAKCENVEGYMLKVKLAVDMYKKALELLG